MKYFVAVYLIFGLMTLGMMRNEGYRIDFATVFVSIFLGPIFAVLMIVGMALGIIKRNPLSDDVVREARKILNENEDERR